MYTQQRVWNLTFAIRKRTNNMASIFVRVGSCWHSFQSQRIVFRLPPYDTPRAAPCNKAEIRVHCRHAMGGVCKQRMTPLRSYIYIIIYIDCIQSSTIPMSIKLVEIMMGQRQLHNSTELSYNVVLHSVGTCTLCKLML